MANETARTGENPGAGDYTFRDMLARIPAAETDRPVGDTQAPPHAPRREHPRFSINVADSTRSEGPYDQGVRWATHLPVAGKVGAALFAVVAVGGAYHLAMQPSAPTGITQVHRSGPSGTSAVMRNEASASGTLMVEPVFVRADALASRFSGTLQAVSPVGATVSPASTTGKYDAEDQARALFLQGEARLADGDVMGARMFFKRGADVGDPQSASALGATYDPNLFSRLDVRGMRPDIALARHWYQQAINLGSKDARDHLDLLPTQ